MKQTVTLKRLSSILLTFLMVFTLIPPMTAKAEGTTEIAINETNFPDPIFREYVTAYDSNADNILSDFERQTVTEIQMQNIKISSLKGIEHFNALRYLHCSNSNLTSLDISRNTDLKTLVIEACSLTSLDVSNNIALERLYCSWNKLTSLDVRNNINLERLYCKNNRLTTLDVRNNTRLENLMFDGNNIVSIDLSKNTLLSPIGDYDTSCDIDLAADNTFDFNNLPEFDITKASGWNVFNAPNSIKLSGKTLHVAEGVTKIRCYYDNGNPNLETQVTFYVDHTHSPRLIKAQEASCNERGRKEHYQCSICNKYFKDKECKSRITENIEEWESTPKKKHSYDEKTVYKATPAQNGVIIKKCTKCGHETSEQINCPEIITLQTETYTYNGKIKKPTVSVIDCNGNPINAANFDIIYEKGCKNVGTYDVTINFKGEHYAGRVIKTFTINPKNTSLKKLSSGRKSITVKWKKLSTKMKKSRITGYQIQYSASSKFNNAKMKKVKGYKVTSKKLTRLKAKKKYYVRIRTYMTIDKKTYYSTWSKTKTVKTK